MFHDYSLISYSYPMYINTYCHAHIAVALSCCLAAGLEAWEFLPSMKHGALGGKNLEIKEVPSGKLT
jgi:hypothetical protein